MSFTINSLKASPTRKRFDLDVTVKKFLADPYGLKIRILSRDEIDQDDVEDVVQQIIDRQDKAKAGKKNKILSLNGFNATAYFNKK